MTGKTRTGGVLCDVPVDEYVPWICSDDYALWHATICAADPQDLWRLTFRGALEELGVFFENGLDPFGVGLLEV
jgi:hypothetical protein